MTKRPSNHLVGRIGISPNNPSFRLGGMRTHLAAAAFLAKTANLEGVTPSLLVRIDDTNETRARRECEDSLLTELQEVAKIPLVRLGVEGRTWVMRQSERIPRYLTVADHLRQRGLVRVLEDGSAMVAVKGDQLVQFSSSQDTQVALVRVLRKNGWPLWHFASAIDDADTGVALCIRGIDKQSAEPAQRAIIKAIGAEPPRFYYLPKMIDAESSDAVSGLRREGYRDAALFGYLASSLVRDQLPHRTFDELSTHVEVRSDLRSRFALDRARLSKLDRQLPKAMSGDQMEADLKAHCLHRDDHVTFGYVAERPLSDLLMGYPRTLRDQYHLASSLAHHHFESLIAPEGPVPPFNLAFQSLSDSADETASRLSSAGMTARTIHQFLRWVLSGCRSGPHYKLLWAWHRGQGTLQAQIEAARKNWASRT